ncbi:MAG: magnesium transporter [Candidatus Paceibacteria bacterium]
MSDRFKNLTAIDCMVENVPVISPKATIGEIVNLLSRHASSYSSVAYVYLVNSSRQLTGVVSVKEVFTHSHHTIAAAAAKATLVSVPATMRAEQVALTAINHNLKAVPVVDQGTGRLLGVVTPDKIRDILHYGRIADALAHAGTTNFEDPQNSLLSGTPLLHIRKRLPWLILGLLGGLLAASIVQRFEEALAVHVLIVAFIPLVVYLADAVGSQTEIIFVRAIALDPELGTFARFRRYFFREVIVSGTLATILGVVVGCITSWWFGASELVPLLFTAILATLMLAMVVALVIPFLATKLKYDPALTSGPVATVIRDVMTLWVYFLIVALFL